MTAVQDDATSIRVTWIPTSPLGGTTGYMISFTGGSSSGSVTLSVESANSYSLTNLTNGVTYTILFSTISVVPFNKSLVVPLGKYCWLSVCDIYNLRFSTVPSAPVVNTSPTVTSIAITITGSVPSGSVVTGLVIQWQRDTSVGCSYTNMSSVTVIGNSFTGHTVGGLGPGNRYTITVTAFNAAGSGPVSNAISAMTTEIGKREPIHISIYLLTFSFTAPSSGHTSVRVTAVTASSITVQWEEVLCLNRNGEITGYTVQAVRNGVVERTTNVSGTTREATISGLSPSTWYTVHVAAVNGAGTGPYSTGISIRTSGKCKSFLNVGIIHIDNYSFSHIIVD